MPGDLTTVISATTIRGESGPPTTNKYGLNWPKQRPAKSTPKIAHSALLSEDPTDVTSAINHAIFIKWP